MVAKRSGSLAPVGVVVEPHAVERYRERIDTTATVAEAERAIRAALAGKRPLEAQRAHRTLYAVHGDTWRLVVRHVPGWAPAVITVLWSNETPEAPTDEEFARFPPVPAPLTTNALLVARAAAEVALTKRERAAAHEAKVRAEIARTREEMEAAWGRRLARAEASAQAAAEAVESARVLLVRCRPHVPDDLRVAIEAEIQGTTREPTRRA